MLRRFSLGINPPEYKKRLHRNATAINSTFCRVNLSLASCTSAELASVLVQNKIHIIKLYLQPAEKSSHVQHDSGKALI
jgi:hypothetical protein